MEFNGEYIFNLTRNEWLKEINETLLKLNIQLCDSQGYYRSIYSLFDELSKKWSLLKKNIKCKECKYWQMEDELPWISEFMECTRVDESDPDWYLKWHFRGPNDSCKYGERR